MLRRRSVAVILSLTFAAPVPSALAADAGHRDRLRSEQWGLAQIHAPEAWSSSRGRGVVVAVVDTGVDLAHPDLAGQLVPGANLVSPGKPHRTTSGTARTWPVSSRPRVTTAGGSRV